MYSTSLYAQHFCMIDERWRKRARDCSGKPEVRWSYA
jgi:hypothetical protein